MFGLFKKRRIAAPSIDYDREWQRLLNAYADPAIELAKTKQALIVSAASVLDRIWNGNGGLGWDESCEEDYVAPLREQLAMDALFSEMERAELLRKLDDLVAVGRENIKRAEEAAGEETAFESAGGEVDYIVDRAIEWCVRHPEPIPISDEEPYLGHD